MNAKTAGPKPHYIYSGCPRPFLEAKYADIRAKVVKSEKHKDREKE